jgi:hypothetical protein
MNINAKNTLFLMMTVAAVSAGLPSVARADGLVTAKIPFTFIVGDTRLPAGDYTISETSSGPSVLLVESTDGTRVSFVSTIAATPTDGDQMQPDVEFQTVGKEHFLSRVDMHDGMAREVVLSPSIMEKELVKSAERSAD